MRSSRDIKNLGQVRSHAGRQAGRPAALHITPESCLAATGTWVSWSGHPFFFFSVHLESRSGHSGQACNIQWILTRYDAARHMLGPDPKTHSRAASHSICQPHHRDSDRSTCTLTSFSNRECSLLMQLWQMLIHKRGNMLYKNWHRDEKSTRPRSAVILVRSRAPSRGDVKGPALTRTPASRPIPP